MNLDNYEEDIPFAFVVKQEMEMDEAAGIKFIFFCISARRWLAVGE